MIGIRWLLALLCPAVALAVTFVAAVLATFLLERWCPPDLMISGVCTAPWYPPAEIAAFSLSALMGGAVFVAMPAWLAPDHKVLVAWVAFGAGLTFAVLFVWHGGPSLVLPFAASVVGGLVAAFKIYARAADAA